MPSKRIPIPFTGQHSKGKNVFMNSEECINYYPEAMKSLIVLRGCPGKLECVDVGTNQSIDAQIVSQGYVFVVSGGRLHRYDKNYNTITIDGIMDVSAPIAMVENELQIGIFGGARGYYYTHATETLAEITDADFPGASTATYQDGYAIVSKPDSAQFYLSDLNDFSSWDGLEFSSASWKSDQLIRVFSYNRDLWLFGDDSVEIRYNAGTGTPPFRNIDGAEIEIGCAAPGSVASGGGVVFWLGNDAEGTRSVLAASARSPREISTTSITETIEGFTTVSDAIGFTYHENNHLFYELTFPTEDTTFVYDLATQLWHKRSTRSDIGTLGRNRINNHVYYDGKHMVGDYTNGKIYEMSRDYYDENGDDLIAQRSSPTITQNQDLMTFNEIQILFGPGTGITTGDSEDMEPKAILDWSDDGGITWGNALEIPIGKLGEYKNRAIEYRLGQARNRVFRIKVSAAVERDILGAFSQVEVDA